MAKIMCCIGRKPCIAPVRLLITGLRGGCCRSSRQWPIPTVMMPVFPDSGEMPPVAARPAAASFPRVLAACAEPAVQSGIEA